MGEGSSNEWSSTQPVWIIIIRHCCTLLAPKEALYLVRFPNWQLQVGWEHNYSLSCFLDSVRVHSLATFRSREHSENMLEQTYVCRTPFFHSKVCIWQVTFQTITSPPVVSGTVMIFRGCKTQAKFKLLDLKTHLRCAHIVGLLRTRLKKNPNEQNSKFSFKGTLLRGQLRQASQRRKAVATINVSTFAILAAAVFQEMEKSSDTPSRGLLTNYLQINPAGGLTKTRGKGNNIC